jgi:DNA-binding response OmpR family regulator
MASRPCVLLVDDELAIRLAVKRYFSRRGWDVCEAEDGESAPWLLEPNAGGSFDLVICDLRLPRFSGDDLYRWLSSSRPDAARRLVFSSGDVESPEAQQFLLTLGRPVLPKPFELAEIDRIVEEICPSAQAA